MWHHESRRLAEAGVEPSVGSRGDSYYNALAESVIGLYKTEEIHRRGPWKGVEDVEFASSSGPTTTARRLQPAWRHSRNELSGEPGAVQALAPTHFVN